MKSIYDFFTIPFRIVPCNKLSVFLEFLSSFLAGIGLLLVPYFASQIIYYVTNGDSTGAYMSLLFLALTYIGLMIAWWVNYHSYSINDLTLMDGLYERFMNKICSLKDKYSDEITAGKILNMLNSDAVQIPYYIDDIFEIINSLFMTIGLSIILFLIDYRFSLITLGIGVVYIVYVNHYNKKSSIVYEKRKKEEDKFSSQFVEYLTGLRELKTLDMEDSLYNKMDKQKKINQKLNSKYGKYRERFNSTANVWINLGKVLLYVCSIIFMIDNKMDIATMVLVISYYETLVSQMRRFVKGLEDARISQVSIRRIQTILNLPTEDTRKFGLIDNDLIYGNIVFENVYFQYDNHIILNNANMKIKPKTVNCIVGESGCGKSTIMHLLLRLKQINHGNIYIDGKNLEDYSKEILSSSVTAVAQKPFLYHMSIRENFNLIDSDIINQVDACKKVGIHDFIMSLPKGYNTVLRENASNVSGGQRQLLSIARALLTKAEILIFDDITSSLDPIYVKQVANLINELKKEYTILIVTNKEQIINISDQIIVLENGNLHAYQNLENFKSDEIEELKVVSTC